jgi:hypothetical protein
LGRWAGSLFLGILTGIAIVSWLDAQWSIVPSPGAVSDGWYVTIVRFYVTLIGIPVGIGVGIANHRHLYEKRQCKSCHNAWSREKTDNIRNLHAYTYEVNKTKTEYKGAGDKRKSRTLDIIDTYEVKEFDRVHKCVSCDWKDTDKERREKKIRSRVTATTPWQYE